MLCFLALAFKSSIDSGGINTSSLMLVPVRPSVFQHWLMVFSYQLLLSCCYARKVLLFRLPYRYPCNFQFLSVTRVAYYFPLEACFNFLILSLLLSWSLAWSYVSTILAFTSISFLLTYFGSCYGGVASLGVFFRLIRTISSSIEILYSGKYFGSWVLLFVKWSMIYVSGFYGINSKLYGCDNKKNF